MKYFNNVVNLEELKSEYRRLAMENHPDLGGDNEAMKDINAEFEMMFIILKKRGETSEADTSASDFRRQFYTQNGWAGSRYNPNLSLRDIAPIIRGYVKDVYPTWKFSVVQEHYAGGCGLYVRLMEAPVKIFTDEGIRQWAKRLQNNCQWTEEEAMNALNRIINQEEIQNWNFYYDYMTERAKEVLTDVQVLLNSYRYDDSDGRFDYFDTNFYPHFYIGKYNKPLKIVHRTERISSNNGSKGARRLTA